MQEIIVDEEFRTLLPALDQETYAMLEANLLEHGCRDALVLWDGVLIDGYNRYSVCKANNIPFNTISKEFASREEVLIWIISNQISRRNMTTMQISHFRGLHYRAEKKIQGTYERNTSKTENDSGDHSQSTTADRLSGQYHVSPKTIKRDAKVSGAIDAIGEVSNEAKRMILSGEVSIDKKVLEGLSSGSREDLVELATKIEDGTYEKKRPATVAVKADEGSDPPGALSVVHVPSVPESGETDHMSVQQIETAAAQLMDDLFYQLQKYSNQGNAAELKTALRIYINLLEGLLRKV